MNGPKTKFAQELHKTKYRSGTHETWEEFTNRLAAALARSDEHRRILKDLFGNQKALPGGRIQASAGRSLDTTMLNCYASMTIDDSFVEGESSIMNAASAAASTMRMGGGIGYDFSTLRPAGSWIKGLGSNSSGPIPFMGIFNAVCECTASAGNRRGAQMAVLRVDHPDIEAFIRCKHDSTSLNGFNISVGVTDEFMEAVANGTPFDLKFKGEKIRSVDARTLWEQIMRSTWDWAEPGVLFLDTINTMNNLRYCETIATTNPCGEQPLPPHGACLLGSMNLVKYCKENTHGKYFDYFNLYQDTYNFAKALDKVNDLSRYPLPEQRREALMKRRMGIGVTGYANAASYMGHDYGSNSALIFLEDVLRQVRNASYEASIHLAIEDGPFPAFDREKYLGQDTFVSTLPNHLITEIEKHGLRNSHLTSIAPTGTISLCADNVSSGIEPVFAKQVDRVVQLEGGAIVETLKDYGYAEWGIEPKPASLVTVKEHLDTLLTAQKFVDSSVSKTCVVPASTPWSDFKDLYMGAWMGGAKGITTFTDGGKREGILKDTSDAPEDKAVACKWDPETGQRSCE